MSKENGIVGVDFETLYTSEYSLSKMSVANYVKDPRFDAYLVSIDDGEHVKYVGRPEGFDWSRLDGMTIAMHNASFDWCVLNRLVELGKVPRMPLGARFVCTADLAAWLGVKRDLRSAAKYLLGEEVSKATRAAAMGKASADLVKDAAMLEYSGEDARLCYAIASKFLDQWPEKERRISELNREAGIRGIHTDVALVDAGIASLAPQLEAELDKIPWVKNGDKPLSPNALRAHGLSVGIPVPASLAKDNPDFIEWAAEYGAKHPWVKAVGQYRSINAMLCKVQSIRAGIDGETGMFPFGIRYFGAATGRFSGGSGEGGGKVNMQNLPRGTMFGVDVRHMFMARPGHVFLVADYHQIEARALLFSVGNKPMLELMRAGKSVYQAYAEAVGLATPGSNLKHDNPEKYRYVKACLSGDTLVLTNRGYIPIVHITDTDLVWDGLNWVNQKGPVCNGIREWGTLVHYHGEAYTDDHPVFTGPGAGDAEPIGALRSRGEISKLAWRKTPGSEWADVWELAGAVGRAILLLGGSLRKVLVHGLRKRLCGKLVQLKARQDDPM